MRRRTSRSTFFLDDEEEEMMRHESKRDITVKNHITISNSSSSRNKNSSSSDDHNPVLGLRLLIDDHHQYCSSNITQESNNIIIVKPTFRLLDVVGFTTSSQLHRRMAAVPQESNFLKACCLCKKKLSPQKEVYMYRGDQGFCSVDCRCRQIFIDEMKEVEASTKEILASSRHCPSNVRVAGLSGRRSSDVQAAA